jgi:alpha-tubulin suppressor-like RCC1 family protein
LDPINIEFEVKLCEKNDEIIGEIFLDENKKHRKHQTDYIINFESISWGVDHCLFVDKSNRVFSMGFGHNGRLGHGDDKDRKKPTLIKELSQKNIVDV